MRGYKEGWRPQWFLHKNWNEANEACIHATGHGLYESWGTRSGCTWGNAWLTYENVAEAIASLAFRTKVGEDD